VFFILDASSHSASDTLRPLFLSIGPVWLVAIWATRIVLRTRRASRLASRTAHFA
jgi:hypothetical protein